MVVGALLLSGTAVNMFLFAESGAEIPAQSRSLKTLITNIDFCIDIVAVSTCFAIIGFNEATLEPHIRQFNLTPTIIGTIFLIAGIVDALSSPLVGYCAEKLKNAQYLTLVGCMMFTVCFIVVGPVPFLHFPTYLSVVIVAQFLLGLGMAMKIVCSFTHGMKHTV
ncbi:MFS-type transporter, partial [Stegodyphus mimosarum]